VGERKKTQEKKVQRGGVWLPLNQAGPGNGGRIKQNKCGVTSALKKKERSDTGESRR